MLFDGDDREPQRSGIRQYWSKWKRARPHMSVDRFGIDLPTLCELFRSHDRCAARLVIFSAERHVFSLVFGLQGGCHGGRPLPAKGMGPL